MIPNTASAFSVDTNLFYFSDTFTASTDSTNNRMFIDFSLNLDLAWKGHLIVGWAYSQMNISDTQSSTTTTYTLTEMGPRFGYYLDKEKSWGLFLTYNLQAKGNYDPGSAPVEWRGTSLKGEFGYRPQISEQFHAGIFLIYHSATFTEELANSTTYSVVSYTRAVIYPAISLSYFFN